MWEFLNQPLSGASSLILIVVLGAVIFAAIKLGHKKARDISKQFLTEHPDAATLYIYGEDLPSNSAELDCVQGTVSKVYDPRTVPGAKAQKGAACHALPRAARKGGAQHQDHLVKKLLCGQEARQHGGPFYL